MDCLGRNSLIAILFAAVFYSPTRAEEGTNAVTYRKVLYLSLDKLADVLHAKTIASAGVIRLELGEKQWELTNGGDRLKSPSGKEQPLKNPILVLEGKHFIPLEEC